MTSTHRLGLSPGIFLLPLSCSCPCPYSYPCLSRSLLARPHQYTEILTGKEGGAAAATVELMAGKRMNFRTEVRTMSGQCETPL